MYCLTMLSGAPATEPAKYEPDQSLLAPVVVACEVGKLLPRAARRDALE